MVGYNRQTVNSIMRETRNNIITNKKRTDCRIFRSGSVVPFKLSFFDIMAQQRIGFINDKWEPLQVVNMTLIIEALI